MIVGYSVEKNVQMLVFLLKKRGIRKVVASPGTTNVAFVISVQNDPFFEVYSCVDERSAAYIACGMAAESEEPVVISCTGATASRNYLSGLTEAFYRHLPVLAVTSTQPIGKIGHNFPQMIDRTNVPNDVANDSFMIPIVNDAASEWEANVKLNKALIKLTAEDCGPVHLNLTSAFENGNEVDELPITREIRRYTNDLMLPEIKQSQVAIFVGNHKKWSRELTFAVDEFCEKYNGVVFCDHTSKYKGKYGVLFNLVSSQNQYTSPNRCPQLLIDMGDVSGAYMHFEPEEVWRIDIDGEARDTYYKLKNVFYMSELDFFNIYNKKRQKKLECSYYSTCISERENLLGKIPSLPFSNLWMAKKTAGKLPENSVLHLGILNSLRCWNYFDVPESVYVYSNTGGFGIDGDISSLVGASLVNPDKLYFGVMGDLAFFYDINVMGNRHVGNNLRLIVVNNGRGTEFTNYSHMAYKFGKETDKYIAAAGHFGNQSECLIKHYAEDLGFKYMSAKTKEEYMSNLEDFLNRDADISIVFEVFTDSKDESDALKIINNMEISSVNAVKNIVRGVVGEKNVDRLKKIIGR